MQIRSAKQKGHRLEKEVAKLIKEAFNLTEDDVRTTVGSETGADIKLSAKARVRFPYSIECKNRETFGTLYKFYDQASRHYPELIPMLIIKSNHKKKLAVLDFDFLLTILSKGIK